MRRIGWMAALLVAGCSGGWSGFPPGSGPATMPAMAIPEKVYGRPLELVRDERVVATPAGTASAAAHALRSEVIPGIAQIDANDCGPAALATLLGFYGLRPAGDPDPLRAVKRQLPPRQWGTPLEEASEYLNRTGALWSRPYRSGTLEGLMAIVQDGRPVPVVVTLEGNLTRMHWLLVVGLARTPSGERFVLCKNPSEADPLAVSAYAEPEFLVAWENGPLRSQWWSSLMAGVADSHPESYRRPYLDVGALLPP